MFRRSLLLVLVSALGTQGCSSSKECTLIGCADSFQISFTGARSKPGRYQVEVVADSVVGTCQITLPHACGTQPSCSGGTANWQLMVVGCEPGASEQGIAGLRFYKDAPASLDFVVRRDDLVVGGASAQPVYRESRPNGPECEPICRQAPDMDVAIGP